VLPSSPGETTALLGTPDPVAAGAAARALGAQAAAVTCGPAGTVARLAAGDDVVAAAHTAAAAASLSLQGQGGTGFIPPLAETLAHLAGAPASTPKVS
jgi:2-dehydro-3-deoxygluconokinase